MTASLMTLAAGKRRPLRPTSCQCTARTGETACTQHWPGYNSGRTAARMKGACPAARPAVAGVLAEVALEAAPGAEGHAHGAGGDSDNEGWRQQVACAVAAGAVAAAVH